MSDYDDLILEQIPAKIFMFAGASDDQQSTEVSNVKTFRLPDPAGKAGGACTSALLQTLYRDDDVEEIKYTWAETLALMRDKIEEIGLNQQPQLSSSRPIDLNEELYIVPPDCKGTKRALLAGVNYVGEANALSGCQKDTRNVKEYLIKNAGFLRENMLITMDDGKHHQPTKKLIEDGLMKLAEISQPGDCIFVQFSGHGGRIVDSSGDEDDGYDEILIPGDYKESGHILDDWLYSEFVQKIVEGVHVVILIDCCHSGTALDLPYICNVGDAEIQRASGYDKFLNKQTPSSSSSSNNKKSSKKKTKEKAVDSSKADKKKKKSSSSKKQSDVDVEEESSRVVDKKSKKSKK